MTTATKQQQADRQESIERLTAEDGYNLQRGDTIYTSHHAPSTHLKLFVIKPDHNGNYVPFNITWHVARALDIKPKDKDGEWYLVNGVVGMDRGFDVVYSLSRTLFTGTEDAGYALNHRWL